MKKYIILFFCIFLSLQSLSYAEISIDNNDAEYLKPYKKHKVVLLSDNDAYVDIYSDKYYSAAHRISYISPEWNFHGEDNESKASWLGKISVYPKNNVTSYFVSISQEIYTPDDKSENVSPLDHPYAGGLYLSIGVNQRRDISFERIWLDIGVVGKYSFAQNVQNGIHTSVNTDHNSVIPWSNQVGDEFIMNLHYSWTGKLRVINTNIISAHLLPSAAISLGNGSTFLDLNMRLKIGHNLDASFGTPKMNFGQDFNGVISDDFSIYVYGGIGYRFTLRNIYIQGNTWEDPFRQDLDPFVNYFEGGLALAYKGFELSYSVTYKSREYIGQPLNHTFGSIMISFAI